MLSIHVCNVGHGDSIVVEFDDGANKSFGVVDCNSKSGTESKALSLLKRLGAESLSFVVLTHPHKDHYSGLAEIMDEYRGRIGKVFSFSPARDQKRIAALIAKYATVVRNKNAGKNVRAQSIGLIKFLEHAKLCDWEDPSGLIGILDVSGFHGVNFEHVLPPAKVKGSMFNDLDSGVFEVESPTHNELTLAIRVIYGDVSVLLGGDGVRTHWLSQSTAAARSGKSIGAQIVKLPHHGSGTDCADDVLEKLFDSGDGEKIALISANGNSHPSKDVLDSLKKRNIKPYCTNLSRACGGGKVHDMLNSSGIESSLARFIGSVAQGDSGARSTPCQGDLTIRIDAGGSVSVDRELKNLCTFRRDFENLALL